MWGNWTEIPELFKSLFPRSRSVLNDVWHSWTNLPEEQLKRRRCTFFKYLLVPQQAVPNESILLKLIHRHCLVLSCLPTVSYSPCPWIVIRCWYFMTVLWASFFYHHDLIADRINSFVLPTLFPHHPKTPYCLPKTVASMMMAISDRRNSRWSIGNSAARLFGGENTKTTTFQ